MNWSFRRFAAKAAEIVRSSQSFFVALLMVLVWGALGPRYGWSEGHQLFINTVTTVVTFLIVFLIQNTQNRDTKALHLKIDELLKATGGARNSMIDLDRLSDEQLRRLEAEFKRICADDEADGAEPGQEPPISRREARGAAVIPDR
jgi:low affinity Fe/Cu permease